MHWLFQKDEKIGPCDFSVVVRVRVGRRRKERRMKRESEVSGLDGGWLGEVGWFGWVGGGWT